MCIQNSTAPAVCPSHLDRIWDEITEARNAAYLLDRQLEGTLSLHRAASQRGTTVAFNITSDHIHALTWLSSSLLKRIIMIENATFAAIESRADHQVGA